MNVWDLKLDADLQQPLIALLYAQLCDALGNLEALVRDLTQAELEYRGPDGDLNSPAMLMRHLALTDQLFLHRFREEGLPADFGPRFYTPEGRLPVVTGVTQTELLAEHRAVLAEIKAHLLTLTDTDLTTPLFMNQRRNVTRRQALWHMAEHSMLHQGQIRWLKTWARKL